MERKLKKFEYPGDWNVVEESEDSDDTRPPFETVSETQDIWDLSQEPFQLTVAEARGRREKKPKRNEPKKVTPKSKSIQTRTVQRTKSSGTILEKAFRKGKGYLSVVCRLFSICSDSLLVEEIKRTAGVMKQIQMETWHLVNLHTLRCLESGLSLPDYGNTFFDHCCAGVAPTSKTYLIAEKNPSLWTSIQIYRAGRQRAGLEEIPNMTGFSELKKDMRQTMVTNAGVMIREHFRKRLRVYVEIAFGGSETDKLPTKEKKARKERLRNILNACYNTDDTDLLEALQMRDVLTPDGVEWSEQWIPWPNHMEENDMDFYVRRIWEFQYVVEARMDEIPNEKGVRAFALFPVSSALVKAHITINGSTLAGFYSRIPDYMWYLPTIPLLAFHSSATGGLSCVEHSTLVGLKQDARTVH